MEGFTKEGRNENTVKVTEEKYKELVLAEAHLDMIRRALKCSARRIYQDGEISFKDDVISLTLRMIFPELYEEVCLKLKEENKDE